MGKLKIVVLYDASRRRGGDAGRRPTRRRSSAPLDKKEVEEEVAEALAKLGTRAGAARARRHAEEPAGLARVDCDLVFNLAESFAGDDTADFKIAAFLELLGKKYTGSGTHGLMLAQDKAVAKKIFAFHGIHTPTFARVTGAGSTSRTTCSSPSSSSRRARTARSASSSAPWSARSAS
jgi:D-alanine-D-alanine ligase